MISQMSQQEKIANDLAPYNVFQRFCIMLLDLHGKIDSKTNLSRSFRNDFNNLENLTREVNTNDYLK